MTDAVRRKIEYTLSTQAIERMVPSKEAIRLCKKLSDGTINANAAIDTLKLKYGVSERKNDGTTGL